jgi:hypothetical protein
LQPRPAAPGRAERARPLIATARGGCKEARREAIPAAHAAAEPARAAMSRAQRVEGDTDARNDSAQDVLCRFLTRKSHESGGAWRPSGKQAALPPHFHFLAHFDLMSAFTPRRIPVWVEVVLVAHLPLSQRAPRYSRHPASEPRASACVRVGAALWWSTSLSVSAYTV